MIGTRPPAAPIDLERFRLRTFIESLGDDQLERRREPVALRDVAAVLEGNPRAVLFERVGADGHALAGNVLGSRERMARAFGVDRTQLLPEILRRLQTRPELIELSRDQAPVQEVVLTGAEVDLTTLPVHLQHGRDGGLYISAGIDFAIDPLTKLSNVGLRRFMLHGRRTTGIDLVAASDLRTLFRASLERGEERFPLSVVVGSHPIDYFAATMRLPVDEIRLLAQLRGAPLPVVKSVTNDILVPADAEYVIEGYLGGEGYVRSEGPFGEFLGYYGGVKTNPVFHVTAITHRRDPVFQTLSISGKTMSRTDTAQLTTLRTEVLVWRALEIAVREPVAVYAPPATGGVYNVRVAIRQRNPGEARNAIAAVFACMANVKNVFVVDPDVDVFDDEQMEWALATRLRPETDIHVESGFRVSPLDPSLPPGARTGSKAGFDLTLPLGTSSGLELTLPVAPTFKGKRYPSVRAALEDGPKSFEELMAAIGTDDGREIVVMLEELYDQGLLERDPVEGTYFIKPVR
jgi:2,5-furandicarboxylate decarboxylase 1